MTSAPRTEAPRATRAPWSLQKRLIMTVISIVAFIMVLVAGATSIILGRVLEDRASTELFGMVTQSSRWIADAGYGATAAEALDGTPAQPGTLLAVQWQGAEPSAAVVTDDYAVMELTTDQVDEIEASLAGPGEHTVTIDGVGSYNVRAAQVGPAIVVLGLSRAEVAATIGQMLTVIGLLTAGGLVLLIGATAWTIRAGLKPLRAVADTASRVARQRLDQGAVTISERVPAAEADPRTEVGAVGDALNTLLDHVDSSLDARQRNEERMRRFVADASHELRTPLASIRGYSELSLRAIGQATPELAAETTTQSLDRIQAQSVRMTGIVEDLLLLARLDEGQEIVYGAVDLTRLMIDAVGDAQVAGPEHEWILDVGEEPVQIAGDAARLHQVAANLLANARVHTPPGTAVTGSVSVEAGDAVLRVHDTGPGIPASVQGELFERFARADVSRARQTGGSGLGLSIARAIVEAHRGELTVASAPGDTTFTVRLPLRPEGR